MHDTPAHAPRPRSTSHQLDLLLIVIVAALGLTAVAPPAAAAPVVATPTIVPFAKWAPATCPAPTRAGSKALERVVVHHTHEPAAATPEEVLPALALTCSAHTGRGFSTIGYHYVVDPWGQIYQGRGGLPQADGTPPPTQAESAHVAGSHPGAIGVVFLGDHEDEPPTAAALEAATQLLAWLLEPTGHGPADVVSVLSTGGGTASFAGRAALPALAGHSDSNHTDCPGAHLRALLPELRDRVAQHLLGREVVSWAGLAVDLPAEEQPAREPAPEPARGRAPEEPPAIDAAAEPATGEDAATAEAAVPVGPLASQGELLVRGLRAVGLLSLADQIAAHSVP